MENRTHSTGSVSPTHSPDSVSPTCQNCKNQFTIEPEDFNFYKKIDVPAPTWCPECRLIRRLLWRNERYLYKRSCGLCGKIHLAMYPADAPYVVFCSPCWWSDTWDSLKYGREYDFSEPFFKQFEKLLKSVPLQDLWTNYLNMENSDYNNLASMLKNCYMLFHADNDDGCSYGSGVKFSKDSVDNTMLQHSELCYECVNVVRGYKNYYSVDCYECRNIYFCKNCVNCTDCVGCTGLRNKKYHIFNKPYSKEEYSDKLKELNLFSWNNVRKIKNEAESLWQKYPVKFMHGRHNTNSSGDYIFNSKNVSRSYEMVDTENAKYSQFLSSPSTHDAFDYTEWGEGAELIYESILCGRGISRHSFVAHSEDQSREITYSFLTVSSSSVFGCVGVRSKQYCILNRQYTKEEYERLVPEIIEHMNKMPYVDKQGRVYRYGEFFPINIAPWTYNESTAQEFFPLSRNQVVKQGYRWRDFEDKPYSPTLSWKDLPDTVKEAGDEILKETILCKAWDENSERAKEHNCTKAFRITLQELQFYRAMNIPLPRACYNTRHFLRTQYRNPIRFWRRSCHCASKTSENNAYQNITTHAHGAGKCPNKFETSYSPDRKEIVYCEECYQAEVV